MTDALVLANIDKTFGTNKVLDDATLRVERGSIHALLGENGAGKSTLMRIALGLVDADRGTITIDGHPHAHLDPARATALGVGMVHQHFMLLEPLTVAENVVLGHEPRRGPFFDRARARSIVIELSREHGLEVDPDAPVSSLSVSERQRVEILKVLARDAKLLILDEPTAVLAPHEIGQLLTSLEKLRTSGKTIVLITHKLDEVMRSATRATVLSRGRTVLETEIANATPTTLARAMVGKDVELDASYERTASLELGARIEIELDHVTLRAAGGARPELDDVCLQVRAGEIVGIAGVEGNGQHALERIVTGVTFPSVGRVLLRGQDVTRAPARDRLASMLGYVASDRQGEALVLDLALYENVALSDLSRFARRGVLAHRQMRRATRDIIETLDVRPTNELAIARTLSGGNQQKIVVGRALGGGHLAHFVAQPTRGVDIAAAGTIRTRLAQERDRGAAVLLVSSELDELVALADRIVVLVRGRLVASFERSAFDRGEIARAMLADRSGSERQEPAHA